MLNTWLVARSETLPALLTFGCGIQRLVDWYMVIDVSKYLVPSIYSRFQNQVNGTVLWLFGCIYKSDDRPSSSELFVHKITDVTFCCKHDRQLTGNKKIIDVANVHQPDELQRISRTHTYRVCIKPMSLSEVLPTTSLCTERIKTRLQIMYGPAAQIVRPSNPHTRVVSKF
jgi:hypothetical protein